MISLWQITKNHKTVALEHAKDYGIEHTPTIFQALRMTVYDTLFNKVVFLKEYNSHLVYEVNKVPTLGMEVSNIIRMYVPKEHRGKGVNSLMIEKVKGKIVIGTGEVSKYEEIGRVYVIRNYL